MRWLSSWGTLVAAATRPPPPPCDGSGNPLGGLVEAIVIGLMLLVALILGPTGLIVALLARASAGLALVGVALGLVMGAVIDLNVLRSVGCQDDPRTEPGTIVLTIVSPFEVEVVTAARCFNLRDPDPDYDPGVFSDDFAGETDGLVVEMFGVSDPPGGPFVDISLFIEDEMAMYTGPARSTGSSAVRFDDLTSDSPGGADHQRDDQLDLRRSMNSAMRAAATSRRRSLRTVVVATVAAFLIGLVVVVASRPPSSTCASPSRMAPTWPSSG